MSFSFTAAGTPNEVIRSAAEQAAPQQVPQPFMDAINGALSSVPTDAEVTLVAHGHTGWAEGQRSGQLSLSATMDVRLAQVAPPEASPDAPQPGAERFPEGFTEDAPAGPSASDVDPA